VTALGRPRPRPHRRRLIGPLLLGAGGVVAVTVATAEFIAVARAWL
jgi:hypothetical protein